MIGTMAGWLAALATEPVLLILVGTVLFPIAILLLGVFMELIAQAVTTVISFFTGVIIAFGIRTYATYIGTVIHELSHAAVAFLTGAKVKKITLIPKGTTLGSVEYVLFYYLALSILFHMDLSLQDLRNFFQGFLPFLVFSLVVVTIFVAVVGTDSIRDYALQLQEQYATGPHLPMQA